MDKYGLELIIDLHDCDVSTFTRVSIEQYFKDLCDLIGMQRQDLHFWDDEGVPEEEGQTLPHTVGTSAVQFILTSNVTIHTLDLLEKVFVNIFSCKEFDDVIAAQHTKEWFKGRIVKMTLIERI